MTLGQLASPAPGQFSSLFRDLQQPTAGGRLLLAGEMVSIYHGWIVGALNSAYASVWKLLACELFRHRDEPPSSTSSASSHNFGITGALVPMIPKTNVRQISGDFQVG